MAKNHIHQSHPPIIKRLRRAEGHLRSIIAMMENGRACGDIAQQLHAVEKAITQAKKTLVHDHIDHCLEQTGGRNNRDGQKALQEFKSICKYL